MPSMEEIYQGHAERYDELVHAEDYRGELPRCLHAIADWQGAWVLEGGVGTGRVTQLYIQQAAGAYCYDRSAHMLAAAQKNLAAYADKLTFAQADHLGASHLGRASDIFIQGWSFGHAIIEGGADIAATTRHLLASAACNLKPDGTLILIETLGTAVEEPCPPHPALNEFFAVLEDQYGFTRAELRTDYKFANLEAAVRATGFFFGEEMGARVRKMSSPIVKEWTGVWHTPFPKTLTR